MEKWSSGKYKIVLFPKKARKTDFLADPETNARDRDRHLKYNSLENLPARYGGQNDIWPLDFPPPERTGYDSDMNHRFLPYPPPHISTLGSEIRTCAFMAYRF
jgi:hypothetical protein